jgi:hypothetical protein
MCNVNTLHTSSHAPKAIKAAPIASHDPTKAGLAAPVDSATAGDVAVVGAPADVWKLPSGVDAKEPAAGVEAASESGGGCAGV